MAESQDVESIKELPCTDATEFPQQNMTKSIYIAGPMRGIKYFNFPAFDAARESLRAQGWYVISPADLDRKTGFDETDFPDDYDWIDLGKINFNLHDAIDRDVGAIKSCDAIYMLTGWENSKGAKAEKAIAEWLGHEVLYELKGAEGIEAVSSLPIQRQEDILEEALRITRGDRQAQYGPPNQDFARTAAIWTALKGVEFEPRDVALFMIAIKLSRETHQRKRDNAVDIAGYARCLSLCSNS